MSLRLVGPAPLESEFAERRGTLAGGVTVTVEPCGRIGEPGATVIYRGTVAALIASGAITADLVQKRNARKRGGKLADEAGWRFTVSRSPTKSEPERMLLTWWWLSGERAMTQPGVRELFPEGIPEPPPQPEQSYHQDRPSETAVTAADWKIAMERHLGAIVGSGVYVMDRELDTPQRRYQFAEGDLAAMRALIENFQADMTEAIKGARVVDRQRPALKLATLNGAACH